jgi:predicted 3-demethylubiquinone-9 3-methyltransferase (glyoxalase superfamily)
MMKVTPLAAVILQEKIMREYEAMLQDQKDAKRYRWLKDSSGMEWQEDFYFALMEGRLNEVIDARMLEESLKKA